MNWYLLYQAVGWYIPSAAVVGWLTWLLIMNDPQRCEGGPAALALVAAWMRLCVCSHPMVEHDIIDVGKRKGQRSECLTATARGMCGCTIYRPAPSEPDATQ